MKSKETILGLFLNYDNFKIEPKNITRSNFIKFVIDKSKSKGENEKIKIKNDIILYIFIIFISKQCNEISICIFNPSIVNVVDISSPSNTIYTSINL